MKIGLLLSVLVILLTTIDVSGQNLYRSRATGNWNSPGTWEYSTNNGATWLNSVSTYPVADSAGSVTIRNPHVVTLPSAVTIPIDQLTVNSGATISLSSNSILELKEGAGTDLEVQGGAISGAGTLRANGAGALIQNNAGSNISCNFKVSADLTVYSPPFPNIADFFGSVTVDAGATLSTQPSGYTTRFYGAVTNNGNITTGNNSGNNDFSGPSLINLGTITSYNVSFSDTVSVSGSGSWSCGNINVNGGGMFKLSGNVTIGTASGTVFTVTNNGTVNANNFALTFDGTTGGKTYRMNSGSFTGTSGTIETKGTVTLDIQTGSTFRNKLRVVDGITSGYSSPFPNVAIFHENVVIESAGDLRTVPGGYSCRFLDSVVNNGSMSTGNGSGSDDFAGSVFINNGTINSTNVAFTDTVKISGAGSWSTSSVIVYSGGLMMLSSNITMGTSTAITLTVNGGGKIDMNGFILTMDGTTGGKVFRMIDGSNSGSLGNLNTIGNVTIDLYNTSSFATRLKVVSGTTFVYSSNFPNTANFYNEIIIDPAGEMRTVPGGYNVIANFNLVNNGLISTGNGSGRVTVSGAAFTNNGNVTAQNLSLDGALNYQGTGTISSVFPEVTAGSTLKLLADIKLTSASSQVFAVRSNATIDLNGKKLILDGRNGACTFQQTSTSETSDSGSVETYGSAYLDISSSGNFLAPLKVKTATSIIYNSSFPNTLSLTNTVTIDTAAALSINPGGYTVYMYNDLFNNGTLSTGNGSGVYVFYGDTIVNNGTISASNFYLASIPANAPTQNCILSGTGSFTSANLQITEGTFVQLASNHIITALTVNIGGSFDISSRTLKLTGGGSPILVNGSLISGGSTIEYAGTTGQSTVHTGIAYANMTINNPAGVTLTQSFNIPGLLRITLGTLDLNGKVITFLSGASLLETAGNVITGTSGYITTTRQINAPSSLNVAGFGATVTSSANLGLTEFRRGHTVQTTPGGQSVKRYFVIRPENNNALNATCVFKYDDSELNSINEASLKMLKSTNAGSTYLVGGGTVNTAQNTVTVTAINDFARHTFGLGLAIANIIAAPEGFYNTSTQKLTMRDTVRIQLRNATSPYAVVDSAKAILDSATLTASVLFLNAPNGSYYVVFKHRNSIETWSKTPQVYNTDASLLYNFTSAQAQAFGDNLKLKGTKWVIFGGDVNQDGAVDATDVQSIDNDASNFVSGYVRTDLNGDGFVDGSDFTIGDNNAANFVGKITP